MVKANALFIYEGIIIEGRRTREHILKLKDIVLLEANKLKTAIYNIKDQVCFLIRLGLNIHKY